MSDLTFLDEELSNEYGNSNATLKAVLPGGKVLHISDNVSPLKFVETCPLLYYAFELNAQGRLQASIEASSESAVVSLVRYCYTGSYLASEPDGDNILLLQHAETSKIAEDFDVPELQIMAHGNFSCQIEYACCLPTPPRDLLDTIRFIYRYFASDEARRQHNLVDTLLNYCVAVYLYHKLGESLDFLTAVHEIEAFRQDLCRTNIARNFEDDCAADIIHLPAGTVAESSKAPTTLSSRELPNEMFFDKPEGSSSDKAREILDALSFQRKTLDMKRIGCEIPDLSKQCVSPSALTAALQRYSREIHPEITLEETMRKYKRARIDETTALLSHRSLTPTMSGANLSAVKAELNTVIDEDSFWKGAFEDGSPKSPKIVTEGPSQRARRLIFEYGQRNNRLKSQASDPPATNPHTTTALPYRPNNSESEQTAADTLSDDEDFAIVRRPQTTATTVSFSPMSSPELVPAASIAQTLADDKSPSDDEWTML